MPTYDYVCEACDHQFELFQQMKDDAKKQCPECGKKKLRRLIGPGAAIVFKGSGFYATDYRSESYKKSAAADKPAAATATTEKSSESGSGKKEKVAKK
jgi:putative FmdB family regulatory protein